VRALAAVSVLELEAAGPCGLSAVLRPARFLPFLQKPRLHLLRLLHTGPGPMAPALTVERFSCPPVSVIASG
jgi:hypothetical protein